MKTSYHDDPSLREPLFDLLDAVFPGLRGGIADLARLGASWESVSTPFVAFEDGVPVSHVGRIGIPLILDGRPVTAGSIHAVATRPDRRRRGHFGRLMREAIADSAGRHETLILTTENPEYYEPFGFRRLVEHEFRLERSAAGAADFRLLDLADPADLTLLHRLLETREPVSRLAGVGSAAAVFLFSEARKGVLYSEALDVAVCLEQRGGTLELFDVVGPSIPPAAALLPRLPGPYERVVFHFSPDRLAVDATPRARVLDQEGPSHLMVRGPFPAEGRPFTLPRTGRT